MQSDGDHSPRVCDAALARAFEFLGKRWNGVILGTLLSGPAGFAELGRAVAGISDSVLSDRLTGLCKAGLVRRSVCPGPPITVVYSLTASGQALLPALDELTTWAAANLPAGRAAANLPAGRAAANLPADGVAVRTRTASTSGSATRPSSAASR